MEHPIFVAPFKSGPNSFDWAFNCLGTIGHVHTQKVRTKGRPPAELNELFPLFWGNWPFACCCLRLTFVRAINLYGQQMLGFSFVIQWPHQLQLAILVHQQWPRLRAQLEHSLIGMQ